MRVKNDRMIKRNKDIVAAFDKLYNTFENGQRKYTVMYCCAKVAEAFYLQTRTVNTIINNPDYTTPISESEKTNYAIRNKISGKKAQITIQERKIERLRASGTDLFIDEMLAVETERLIIMKTELTNLETELQNTGGSPSEME
jgi:hypothetical protein